MDSQAGRPHDRHPATIRLYCLREQFIPSVVGTSFCSRPNNIYCQLLEINQTTFTDQQYEYLIIQLKRYHLIDVQWTEFKSILISLTNRFTDDQWNQVLYLLFLIID